jgi:uncharacterized protein (DUF1684 family)
MSRRPGTGVIAAAVWMAACSSGPPPIDTRPYEQRVLEERQAKDEAFRSPRKDGGSPIPEAQRTAFAGLSYFPIDPTYRAPAYLTLESTSPPIVIELQTSTDERDKYVRVGTLGFTISGVSYKLTAFATQAEVLTRLFVPFGDLTNGGETYKGGRFLDLDRTPTGLYDLDFNRAYHPYCVYNPTYICPLPPRENRLAVAIRAGERLGDLRH